MFKRTVYAIYHKTEKCYLSKDVNCYIGGPSEEMVLDQLMPELFLDIHLPYEIIENLYKEDGYGPWHNFDSKDLMLVKLVLNSPMPYGVDDDDVM